MFVRSMMLVSALALCGTASASSVLTWPIPPVSDTPLRYSAESIQHEEGDAPSKTRIRDSMDLQLARVGATGFEQRWTSLDPRVHVLEGPDFFAAMMRALADAFKHKVVRVSLDEQGRYDRLEGVGELGTLVRSSTGPALHALIQQEVSAAATSDSERPTAEAIAQAVDAMLDTLLSDAALEAMYANSVRSYTEFVGLSLAPGHALREDIRIPNPHGGDDLPGKREVVFEQCPGTTDDLCVTWSRRTDRITPALDEVPDVASLDDLPDAIASVMRDTFSEDRTGRMRVDPRGVIVRAETESETYYAGKRSKDSSWMELQP